MIQQKLPIRFYKQEVMILCLFYSTQPNQSSPFGEYLMFLVSCRRYFLFINKISFSINKNLSGIGMVPYNRRGQWRLLIEKVRFSRATKAPWKSNLLMGATPRDRKILTGWHPPLQDFTLASKTRKLDSGILNALKEFWRPLPSLARPRAGKTETSTGHLNMWIQGA